MNKLPFCDIIRLPGNKWLARVIVFAFFLQTVFSFSPQAFAVPAVNPFASEDFKKSIKQVSIPEKNGFVTEVFVPEVPVQKLVFLMQDPHLNIKAQFNQAEIFDELVGQYKNLFPSDRPLIALEGTSDVPLNYSVLTACPSKKIRTEISDFLVNEGTLDGSEYYKINYNPDAQIVGIEDPALYTENVMAFKNMREMKSRMSFSMRDIRKAMNELKRRAYSYFLKKLDDTIQSFNEHPERIKEHFASLEALAKAKQVSLDDFPAYVTMKNLLEAEKQVDKAKLAKELTAFGIFETPFSFSSKQEEQKFLDRLTDELSRAPNREEYAQSEIYRKYLEDSLSINADSFFGDLEKIYETLSNAFAESPREKVIAEHDRMLHLIEKMWDLEMTDEEYLYFKAHQEQLMSVAYWQELNKYFNEFLMPYRIKDNFYEVGLILKEAERFYETAFARNQALFQNLMNQMSKHDSKATFMVAGGFHAKGLSELFRKQNIAYVFLVPQIDMEQDSSLYWQTLAGENKSLEHLVRRFTTKTVRAFVEGSPTEALVAKVTYDQLRKENPQAAQAYRSALPTEISKQLDANAQIPSAGTPQLTEAMAGVIAKGLGANLVSVAPQTSSLTLSRDGKKFDARITIPQDDAEFQKALENSASAGVVNINIEGQPQSVLVTLTQPATEDLNRRLVDGEFESNAPLAPAQIAQLESLNLKPASGKSMGAYTQLFMESKKEKIGEGGFAVVFKVTPKAEKKEVFAYKLSAEELTISKMERWMREGRIQEKISAKTDVAPKYLEHGISEEGHGYFAMELVEGQTLDQPFFDKNSRRPKFEQDQFLEKLSGTMLQAVEAIGSVHKQGVVHRDIKEENLKLTKDGKIKVLDYGLAVDLSSPEGFEQLETEKEKNATVGTPYFIAPEVIKDPTAVTAASDVYAWGVMYFHLLTGNYPVEADDLLALFRGVVDRRRQSFEEFKNEFNALIIKKNIPLNVPDNILKVIQKALEPDPGDRYQNAKEAVAALREALQSLESQSVSTPGFYRTEPVLVPITTQDAFSKTAEVEFQPLDLNTPDPRTQFLESLDIYPSLMESRDTKDAMPVLKKNNVSSQQGVTVPLKASDDFEMIWSAAKSINGKSLGALPAPVDKTKPIVVLGEGAFGQVIKVPLTNGDVYAYKRPSKSRMRMDRDEDLIKKFKTEADLLKAGQASSHVVRLVEFATFGENGRKLPVIITELLQDGQTLDKKYENPKKFDLEIVKDMVSVAEGVSDYHIKTGQINADFKQANIYITNDGTARFFDLGLAYTKKDIRTLENPGGRIEPNNKRGTPQYTAPEMLFDGAGTADQRSDIFSVGIMFFEMLTGELPRKTLYPGADRYSFEEALKASKLPPKSIPPRIQKIINKMIEENPDKRYQTMEAVARDLKIAFIETFKPSPSFISSIKTKLGNMIQRIRQAVTGEAAQKFNPQDVNQVKAVLAKAKVDPDAVINIVSEGKSLGSSLANLEFVEELGKGGFGVVSLRYNRFGDHFAVKILTAKDNFAKKTFARERAILKKLTKLGLKSTPKYGETLYDEANNAVGYSMEYIDGQSLEKALNSKSFGFKTPEEIFQALRDRIELTGDKLAGAVEELHAKAVDPAYGQGVHNDIKPANALVDLNGNVRLIDLGLFTWTNQKQDLLFGTPAFISPERAGADMKLKGGDQAKYDRLKGKSTVLNDVYALGVSLYDAVTGYVPFDGAREDARGKDGEIDPFVSIKKDMEAKQFKIRRPSAYLKDQAIVLPEDVAKKLDNFIGRTMNTNPLKRAQSAADIQKLTKDFLKFLDQNKARIIDELKLSEVNRMLEDLEVPPSEKTLAPPVPVATVRPPGYKTPAVQVPFGRQRDVGFDLTESAKAEMFGVVKADLRKQPVAKQIQFAGNVINRAANNQRVDARSLGGAIYTDLSGIDVDQIPQGTNPVPLSNINPETPMAFDAFITGLMKGKFGSVAEAKIEFESKVLPSLKVSQGIEISQPVKASSVETAIEAKTPAMEAARKILDTAASPDSPSVVFEPFDSQLMFNVMNAETEGKLFNAKNSAVFLVADSSKDAKEAKKTLSEYKNAFERKGITILLYAKELKDMKPQDLHNLLSRAARSSGVSSIAQANPENISIVSSDFTGEMEGAKLLKVSPEQYQNPEFAAAFTAAAIALAKTSRDKLKEVFGNELTPNPDGTYSLSSEVLKGLVEQMKSKRLVARMA